MGSKTNSQHWALLHFCGHIFNTYSMLNGESVQYALTTQISACLQEQVGLMSISSWTLSFSSSPRTWLNFFMKSWAFPASGRFSVNIKQSSIRMSVTWSGMNPNYFEEMCGLKKKKLCGLKLTGNTHQLPKHGCVIGLGLPGERGRNVRYVLIGIKRQTVSFVCVSHLTTGSLWRSSSSLTRPLSMFWHFHISFRALTTKIDYTKTEEKQERGEVAKNTGDDQYTVLVTCTRWPISALLIFMLYVLWRVFINIH